MEILIERIEDDGQLRILQEHHQRSKSCCGKHKECTNSLDLADVKESLSGVGRMILYSTFTSGKFYPHHNHLLGIVEGQFVEAEATGLVRSWTKNREVTFGYHVSFKPNGQYVVHDGSRLTPWKANDGKVEKLEHMPQFKSKFH